MDELTKEIGRFVFFLLLVSGWVYFGMALAVSR